MKASEIRNAFLEFFESKGHTRVQSSSLIPENDPTLLFANAGMNQFKECFLGAEQRGYTRAASSQKCIRMSGKHNDLENVGRTARHQTFFEMLGNFSFGDYFKREAIEYAWEFVRKVLELPLERLWVTVYEDDEEAAELWAELTEVPVERVLRYGKDDNFWSMGDTGPCGPCSEIFYYMGDDVANQSEAEFRKDDGTYMEFWNLVFMQFDRQADGSLVPLPKPSVDTGMGLERISQIVQGVRSNYDTDALRDLIAVCEELSGHKYDGASFVERDLTQDKDYARDVAMRVVADHARTIGFLVAEGVNPGSEGRNYVLRRLIRRAVRHGKTLGLEQPFLARVLARLADLMGQAYPELEESRDLFDKLVTTEERKFQETLESGLSVLHGEREKLKAGDSFSGQTAFLLHDTYGFPLDLTQDVLRAYDIEVDTQTFDTEMQTQKQRSRDDRKAKGISFSVSKVEGAETEFLGYETLSAESELMQLLSGGDATTTQFGVGDEVAVVCSATPFYAESGGQVADTGTVRVKDVTLEVHDVQKVRGTHYVHHCVVAEGELSSSFVGSSAELCVDAERRRKIRINHSATHLVHAALRSVLGAHVKQAGSRVDDRTLRFDYSHFEPVSDEQLNQIQSYVNEHVRSNHEVITQVLPLEEARKTGAVALFGEKYGDLVRVVHIGPESIEFCGGTHVSRSGDVGTVLLAQEGGISAGVRRIECLAGAGAFAEVLAERAERAAIATALKSDVQNLPSKVEKLLLRVKELERELERSRTAVAAAKSSAAGESARTTQSGIKVITLRVDNTDTKTLRGMVDRLRDSIGSGVVALGSSVDGSVILVAGVTTDLTQDVHAGNLVKEAIKISGGRGGGRADFAQAGGGDPAKLDAALDKVFELIA